MNDVIELAILPATTDAWQLIYQDEQFLVVNKPCRLLSVPGRHPANHDCLISRVNQQFPSAHIVHRLDYDTSGLMVLPLGKAALSNISKQFQARSVQKTYQALVAGELQGAGLIDLPIAADLERRPLYKICQQQGKSSQTHFSVVDYDRSRDLSRVDLSPITGRSHQLRLHLSTLGHAILGDEFYASAAVQALSSRLCLHAYQLQFQHPTTGHPLHFQCEVPF